MYNHGIACVRDHLEADSPAPAPARGGPRPRPRPVLAGRGYSARGQVSRGGRPWGDLLMQTSQCNLHNCHSFMRAH